MRPKTRNHLIINKKWLDDLNLAIPTNIYELTNVLKEFKAKNPNGQGNVIPVSFNGDIHIDFLNPFGITDIYGTMMTVKDGRPFFYPTSPEYRAAIKWVRELWEAGLIDQETFTQNWNMFNGKRQNAVAPMVGIALEWTHDAAFGQWSNQYIAIPPLAGPDGKRYAGGDPNGIFNIERNEALITSSCKYPEEAARWLDEFYTNEASIQNFWGAIGTVISKNADGTYSLNDPPADTSADAWYWNQSLRDFGPKYVEASFNDKIKLSPLSGDGLKWETAKVSDPFVMEPYPNIIYTNDEVNDLSTLGAEIGAYVGLMRAKWVTQGGIDADWDGYVRQLEQIGLSNFVKIRIDAFNRYKSQ
jgi:putative aldouronate transport system substrate-binding protein